MRNVERPDQSAADLGRRRPAPDLGRPAAVDRWRQRRHGDLVAVLRHPEPRRPRAGLDWSCFMLGLRAGRSRPAAVLPPAVAAAAAADHDDHGRGLRLLHVARPVRRRGDAADGVPVRRPDPGGDLRDHLYAGRAAARAGRRLMDIATDAVLGMWLPIPAFIASPPTPIAPGLPRPPPPPKPPL